MFNALPAAMVPELRVDLDESMKALKAVLTSMFPEHAMVDVTQTYDSTNDHMVISIALVPKL